MHLRKSLVWPGAGAWGGGGYEALVWPGMYVCVCGGGGHECLEEGVSATQLTNAMYACR
jgi:hypothetical protein